MKSVVGVRTLLFLGFLISLIPVLNAREISKKRGRVTFYHESGTRASSGRVYNYYRNGLWKYWDEQGVLHHTSTFVHDTLHGRYIEYEADGSVYMFGNYARGLKDGTWRTYYSNQNILSVSHYNHGRLHGQQITWYENGQVREIIECENDVLVSRKAWYPEGRLKLVESYKAGLSDGRWVTYPDPIFSDDTFPATVDEYTAGLLNGWHYAFLNGRKMEEVHYIGGKADGICSRWDEHGHLVAQEDFSCGKRDGKCRYFNCGELLRDVHYVNGERSGPQVDYNRNGDTLNVTWYGAGFRDSVKTYHTNGFVATCHIYSRTSDQTEYCEYSEWNEAGIKLLSGQMISEIRNGDWYTWYPNGNVKSLTTYDNGLIFGPYTKWYENGNRMVEYYVIDDDHITTPMVWMENGKAIRPGSPAYNEVVESAIPGETYCDPFACRPAIDKYIADAASPHLRLDAPIEEPAPPVTIQSEDNMIYLNPEVHPSFPGGDRAMQTFVNNHLVHPPKRFHMSGTVLICYIVEKDGSLSNISPVLEVFGAPEFTDEALRIVNMFPKMNPAMKDGEPVRCKVIVPIEFKGR